MGHRNFVGACGWALGKKIAIRAKRLFPKPRKNAYKLAKKGKAHGKLYSDNVGKPTKELKKSIRGLQKRIDAHEKKIAYPITGAPDWSTFPKEGSKDKSGSGIKRLRTILSSTTHAKAF